MAHVDYVCKYTEKTNNSSYEMQTHHSHIEQAEEDDAEDLMEEEIGQTDQIEQEEMGPYEVSSPVFDGYDDEGTGDEEY